MTIYTDGLHKNILNISDSLKNPSIRAKIEIIERSVIRIIECYIEAYNAILSLYNEQ